MKTFTTYQQNVAAMPLESSYSNAMSIALDIENQQTQKLLEQASNLINNFGLGHGQAVYGLVASGVTRSDAEAVVSYLECECAEEKTTRNGDFGSLFLGLAIVVGGGILSLANGFVFLAAAAVGAGFIFKGFNKG